MSEHVSACMHAGTSHYSTLLEVYRQHPRPGLSARTRAVLGRRVGAPLAWRCADSFWLGGTCGFS